MIAKYSAATLNLRRMMMIYVIHCFLGPKPKSSYDNDDDVTGFRVFLP